MEGLKFWCLLVGLSYFNQVIAQDKLLPASGQQAASFGYDLALDNEWLLVGAKDDTINGQPMGAAYFFKNIEGVWVEWQKVAANQGAAGDLFGISVDIDVPYAIIGANGDDEVSLNSGAAYIFELVDDYWVQKQRLLPQESGFGSSEMGIAVSIQDEVLVVGAYSDATNGQFSGAAYLYGLDEGSWFLANKVMPDDGSADDKFGRSVHTDGIRAIISGVLDDDGGINSGGVYVFAKLGENWSQRAKIVAPDAYENDRFGRSVAINYNYIAVGAVLDDDNGQQSGSVYIFKEVKNSWQFQDKLVPTDGQADDFFGYALSFQNPYLLVGAHNDDDYGLNSGAAYLFKNYADSWVEIDKIYAETPKEEANFGESVDLGAQFMAFGAPYYPNAEIITGAVFTLESPIITKLESANEPDFTVYPNPVHDNLRIVVSSNAKITKITILDQLGREVLGYKTEDQTLDIDVSQLKLGFYLLNIELSSESIITRSLLKQ